MVVLFEVPKLSKADSKKITEKRKQSPEFEKFEKAKARMEEARREGQFQKRDKFDTEAGGYLLDAVPEARTLSSEVQDQLLELVSKKKLAKNFSSEEEAIFMQELQRKADEAKGENLEIKKAA